MRKVYELPVYSLEHKEKVSDDQILIKWLLATRHALRDLSSCLHLISQLPEIIELLLLSGKESGTFAPIFHFDIARLHW